MMASTQRATAGIRHAPFCAGLLVVLCLALFSLAAAAPQDPPPPRHDAHAQAIAYSRRGLANANRLSAPQRHAHHAAPDEARTLSDFALSDLVVVSSVEGGMYGLDRETGRTLWSLPPRAGNSTRLVQGFGPLVGTSYGPKQRSFSDLVADLPLIDDQAGPVDKPQSSEEARANPLPPPDGSSGKEALETLQELGLYIVEPSNGQVYVLASSSASTLHDVDAGDVPKSTLSKLPLTLPQLVELSPFSFPGDTSRVFVGHKSTSLVELDVRSGKIGAVFGGAHGASGVWCDGDASTMCEQDSSHSTREWAYMGRTDYTLTIHLRGRPALSQTLHYSTFSPNAADRDIAELWMRQTHSPDRRAIMGMPEDGTLLCFNSSMTAASPRQQQDRTLWIRELSVTVAGIFDVVYPRTSAAAGDEAQPLIVPHPKGSLQSLFSEMPSPAGASLEREQATYLGIAGGQLYAMGSAQYPLVAFTPRAPAGHDEGGDEQAFRDHHARGAASCASYGCLLGSYDVAGSAYGDVRAEELLGLGPGHAPLLGIGDGSDKERDVAPTNESKRRQDSSDAAAAATKWTSPSMILAQIIALFLLAVLCGLLYIGGQELKRQYAEEAKIVSKEVVWAPLPPLTPPPPPPAMEPVKTNVNDDDDVATTTAIDIAAPGEADGDEQTPNKKKPARRRKRGKRAGAAVAQRETKRDDSKEDVDDDSGDDDDGGGGGGGEAGEAALLVTTNGNGSDPVAAPPVDEEVARITAKASLTAEGGEQVQLATGQSAALRGADRSLIISEEVLGYGSSGTVVFKGTFQGRAVAVKRLLRDFVDVAAKEVSLLESADNHANVIRYFYKEVTDSFLFIALELCPASLSDIIEKPRDYQELSALLKPKKALFQIASGLQHLHSLSIVHRDIKPQNILVSHTAGGRQLKMLLSDFGLSKRLDGAAQTSFSQTVNNPGGTFGWRAPEILRGDVSLDAGAETGSSTMSSGTNGSSGAPLNEERKRLTRAVDVFAMGCLTYYVLSNGDHPFGSRFEREMNILRRLVDLARLDGLGEEGHEAQHLIRAMVSHEAHARPAAVEVMAHPYFWDAGRRLAFLQDASDRFDSMERDPPTAPLVALEVNAVDVLGGQDWHKRLDRQVMEDLNKRRRYDPKSVAALLRAIRNKKHHIHDVPPSVKRLFTAAGGGGGASSSTDAPFANASAGNLTHQVQLLPDGFLAYFTSRFPRLFLHTYGVVNGFEVLKREPVFCAYFEPVTGER